MAYDLYVLPVQPGADVEDAAEALLTLLGRGLVAGASAADECSRRDTLAQDLSRRVLDLAEVPSAAPKSATGDPAWRELRSPSGLAFSIAPQFVRCRMPYAHRGEDAEALFASAFDLLAFVLERTGWRIYDPQEAAEVLGTDEGRDATLEIYLSVMDQLGPQRIGERR